MQQVILMATPESRFNGCAFARLVQTIGTGFAPSGESHNLLLSKNWTFSALSSKGATLTKRSKTATFIHVLQFESKSTLSNPDCEITKLCLSSHFCPSSSYDDYIHACLESMRYGSRHLSEYGFNLPEMNWWSDQHL
jgi:hypothetical protein